MIARFFVTISSTRNNVSLAIESEGAKIDYKTTFEGVREIMEDEDKGFYIIAEESDESNA